MAASRSRSACRQTRNCAFLGRRDRLYRRDLDASGGRSQHAPGSSPTPRDPASRRPDPDRSGRRLRVHEMGSKRTRGHRRGGAGLESSPAAWKQRGSRGARGPGQKRELRASWDSVRKKKRRFTRRHLRGGMRTPGAAGRGLNLMKQSQTNPVLNAFFHVSQRVQPSVDRTALIAAAQIDRGLLGAPRSAILAEITTPEARREHRSAARDGAPLRSYFFSYDEARPRPLPRARGGLRSLAARKKTPGAADRWPADGGAPAHRRNAGHGSRRRRGQRR